MMYLVPDMHDESIRAVFARGRVVLRVWPPPQEGSRELLLRAKTVFLFGGSMYEIRPMVGFKILNRSFDRAVLTAIFDIQNENKSLVKLVEHWECWGYASRRDIASRMGYKSMGKNLSVKIRTSFLWLESIGYLKHKDINKPGMDPERPYGATKFLLSYWIFRLIALSKKIKESFKSYEASFRTLVGKKPTHSRGIIAMFSDLRVAEGLAG